jgi:hypothetical protein
MMMSAKPELALTAFLLALPICIFAQTAALDLDGPVVVTSPASWSTLRSDSLAVSVQVDTSQLPKGGSGAVDFKVLRRSGSRSSVLFSKSVKVDGAVADIFLGRVKGVPIGGAEFLSVEWSVPGTELKGVVEPIGVAALNGSVSPENKWIPASQYLSAVRLKDGLSGEGAAEVLAGLGGFSAGGAVFAAGWNASGLFLYFTPNSAGADAEFALDLKCGANAFPAWADRFVAVGADSAYGTRNSARSVDGKEGLKFEESRWGDDKTIVFTKARTGRLVMLDWSELGILPFEGRNIGFAIFKGGQGGKGAVYPVGAGRSIPGTWGGISLAK